MKLFKQLFIPLCLTVAMALGTTGCALMLDSTGDSSSSSSSSQSSTTPVTYTLNLTADKTTALRGDVVTLSAYLHSSEGEDALLDNATFQLVEGGNAATLAGNQVTISQTAVANTIIKVKAKVGATDSNILEIKVNVPLESISVSANNVTNVLSGSSVLLSKTVTPEGADESKVSWQITEGSDYATMNGDILVVKPDMPTGATIKVKAVSGNLESTELSFIIGYPLTDLILAQPTPNNVLSGSSVALQVTKVPANATNGAYTYTITEGAEYATTSGDSLIVNSGVATGTIIKVKAVSETHETEEISFIVGYPLTDLIILVDGSTNIPNGKSVNLTVKKLPENTTNGDYEWEFVSGREYCDFEDGKLTVHEDAPLNAEISLKVVGAVESTVVKFTVGVPLESLTISSTAPAVLTHGASYDITLKGYPDDASTKAVEWVFNEKDWATVVNGKLIISENVPHGATLTVKAVSGSIESAPLTFTVGVKLEELTATLIGKANVDPGAFRQLTISRKPDNTTDLAYTWDYDDTYATIVNDMLFVSEDAPIGTKIYVKAVNGDVESSPIEITVGVPVTEINIELVGSANVDPGTSRPINVTFNKNASQQPIEWVFTEGKDYCSIVNNTLTVFEKTPIGTKISFSAKVGDVESEQTITIIVGTPITEITIRASKSEIVKGESAILSAKCEPDGATAAFEWVITEGDDFADIVGDNLVVDSQAPTGATIKVKAVSGSVESVNELVFTVLATQEEINASSYYLLPSDDSIEFDKNGLSTPILSVELWNKNYEKVTDKQLRYTIVEGSEYLGIEYTGISDNSFIYNLSAKGHGKATVRIELADNKDVYVDVDVNVVVPPSALNLPEVFAERTNFQYNFSMNAYNLSTGALIGKDALAFKATAATTANNPNPCTDVVYTFTHESGLTGDMVATHDGEKITFYMTGLVTVTATSNSGSRIETVISYTFNVNEGFNVSTFEDAENLLDASFYKGQAINFVVLVKPVGKYDDPDDPTYGYEYGYDIVSQVALKKHSDQHFLDLISADKMRLIAENKSMYINGNKHKIDLSQIRVLSKAEITQSNQEYGKSYSSHGSILTAEPWTSSGPSVDPVRGEFFVKIYDLEIVGNTSIAYANADKSNDFVGAYGAAFNVGRYDYKAQYSVDIQNVTASGTKEGFKMTRVVEGTLKNAYAYNCYQNGFAFRSSIMTIENLKLGPCGATGIELAPGESNKAGRNENQPQTITFKGSIDVTSNIHSLDTSYLNTYVIYLAPTMPVNVQYLVETSISVNKLNDNQVAHLRNSAKELCMVTFMLADTGTGTPNNSEAIYPAYQDGGIIDATQLPASGTDTEHQFIKMSIYAAQGSLVGTVLLYNLNYQAK